MADKLEFRVASAVVDDGVRMDHDAPSAIHISAGTRLDIRFDYQLEETSKEEDLWTFRLDVQIPGKEDSVAERRHKDRALFADDTVCHVGIDIDFGVPGTYDLQYTAHVDLSRRRWGQNDTFEQVVQETYEGTVTVHVDGPKD